MTWQRCPVCRGLGVLPLGRFQDSECDICKGKKIIDEKTGKPPEEVSPKVVEKLPDLEDYKSGCTKDFEP